MADDGATTSESGAVVRELEFDRTQVGYEYESLIVPFVLVAGISLATCIAAGVEIFALFHQLQLFKDAAAGVFASPAALSIAATQNDKFLSMAALAYTMISLSALVFGGVWIYRASANVRTFGATGFSISPGWAVGWNFVPLMGFFMPYVAMSETWRATFQPARWQSARSGVLLPVWWGTWLGTILMGNISRIFSRVETTVETVVDTTQFEIVRAALQVVCFALFVAITFRVTQVQSVRHADVLDAEKTFG